MHLYKYSSLLVLILLITFPVYGQEKFSEDTDDFVREFTRMVNSTRRDQARSLTSQFEEKIEEGRINAAHLERMIVTGNLMLSRNMRPNPHLEAYLRSVNAFAGSGRRIEDFRVWSDILDQVVENQRRGNNRNFEQYADFSTSFFTKGAIYESRARTWMVTGRGEAWEYTEEGPVLTFEGVNLIAFTTGDTIEIRNVNGEFNPVEQVFKGSGGRVDWTRAGFGANEVYAEFGDYTFSVNTSELNVDTVTFNYPNLIDEPLMGSYRDRLITNIRAESTNYPRFESFRKDLVLENITDNLTFRGGIGLSGQRISGKGGEFEKAFFEFKHPDGSVAARAYTDEVLIRRNDELASSSTEVSIYIKNDSIYHPSVRLIYKFGIKELALYRGDQGIQRTPFFNSYHNNELVADALYWRMDTDEIQVRMLTGADQNPAVVTSDNYFQRGELQNLQGVMDFNPVSVIKMYADELDSRDMYAPDLAKRMNPNYSENTIKNLLYSLVEKGFIYYDESRGLVTVRDKTFHYVLANANRVDYDLIRFESYDSRENARLNIRDGDMNLNGVEEITLSERRFVYVFPNEEKLTLKENQDMAFDGSILAGRIDFIGFGFYFDYDSFRVDMQDLASAVIYAPTEELDQYGNPETVPLRSQIEGLTGRLFIDAPNNKSGRVNLPMFPIFVNEGVSYVYYDRDDVHNARYERENFYFELEPFRFDSLNTFDPYFTNLTGKLVSSDIFPVFEENIYIRDDLSLGFERLTPEDGFPVYQGKGTFTDSISLSNRGLIGSGKLDYLFTNFNSDHILFLPDSMAAIANNFHMAQSTHQGQTFPEVKGEGVQIGWRPYDDVMGLHSGTEPFVMYDIEAQMSGSLEFTPSGLKGVGSFDWQEAELLSADFNFEGEALHSDTIDMRIKAIDEDKVTFNTPNVKGRIDFTDRVGSFESNLLDIPTDFANNFYRTEINQFTWDMENNVLDFRAPEGSVGAPFVSTHPDTDSLRFLGTRALFDLPSSLLIIEGINKIPVADAHIIPDNNEVTIEGGGAMRTLTNAQIIMDTAEIQHQLYAGDLMVEGLKSFTGEATYDYVNRRGEENPIRFHEIFVEEIPGSRRQQMVYHTRATGQVSVQDSFKLDPNIRFHGETKMKSEVRNLNFNGFAYLDFKNPAIKTNWFAFETDINAENVVIPYQIPLSPDGDTLHTGLYFDLYLEPGPYVALMRPKDYFEDHAILETSGIVKYNPQRGEFFFGPEENLDESKRTGNVMIYNENEDVIFGSGNLNLNLDFEPFNIDAAGSFVQNMKDTTFTMQTVLGLNLEVDNDLIEIFAKDLISFVFDRPGSNYQEEGFVKAFSELVDGRRRDRALDEAMASGVFDKPRGLDYNLFFSHLNLKYQPEYQTYKSEGPIGIAFIGDKGVHKMVNGYIEFGVRRVGDFFNMYFELGPDDWYFLSYSNYTLQIISSREDFNKALAAIDPNRRQRELSEEATYLYTTSTFGSKQNFVYRMEFGDEGDMPPQE